jgi:hypothetical protein
MSMKGRSVVDAGLRLQKQPPVDELDQLYQPLKKWYSELIKLLKVPQLAWNLTVNFQYLQRTGLRDQPISAWYFGLVYTV